MGPRRSIRVAVGLLSKPMISFLPPGAASMAACSARRSLISPATSRDLLSFWPYHLKKPISSILIDGSVKDVKRDFWKFFSPDLHLRRWPLTFLGQPRG